MAPLKKQISKVLIANRGEIAVRIIQTLRTLGIQSGVVYHATEANSLAVGEADEHYEITGETPVSAYLDSEQIVQVALKSGADAVHPGYGFLSENASFAQAVLDAGLLFIGPSPKTIELMGDKIAARDFVAQQGFPIAPSANEEDNPEKFLESAQKIGFPLLLKAAAGGGGKGMHIVRSVHELSEKTETARREAERYFGDGRLFCERYIEEPRHIEVQILADQAEKTVHLWERECSVQRRFQKIIEESPSPALTAELREQICQTAVGIAQAAHYTNAGTVEFIMGPEGDFYFLEMNTRLQVEHPVTEAVTGIDLVAEQIRIASGEPLGFEQEEIRQSGHSIEVRIYAEDVDHDFLPAIGKVLALNVPSGLGIRFDSSLKAGQEVTANFDPMLAKLIVHANSRPQTIARLRHALQELVILGVTTNCAYLEQVIAHPAFGEGETHTGFVEQYADDLKAKPPDPALRAVILVGAALQAPNFLKQFMQIPEPYRSMGRWRN